MRPEDGEHSYRAAVVHGLCIDANTYPFEDVKGGFKLALSYAKDNTVLSLGVTHLDDKGAVDPLVPKSAKNGASYTWAIGDAQDADAGQIALLDDAADSEPWGLHFLTVLPTCRRTFT